MSPNQWCGLNIVVHNTLVQSPRKTTKIKSRNTRRGVVWPCEMFQETWRYWQHAATSSDLHCHKRQHSLFLECKLIQADNVFECKCPSVSHTGLRVVDCTCASDACRIRRSRAIIPVNTNDPLTEVQWQVLRLSFALKRCLTSAALMWRHLHASDGVSEVKNFER